jgi:hypothetical protein
LFINNLACVYACAYAFINNNAYVYCLCPHPSSRPQSLMIPLPKVLPPGYLDMPRVQDVSLQPSACAQQPCLL